MTFFLVMLQMRTTVLIRMPFLFKIRVTENDPTFWTRDLYQSQRLLATASY